MLLDPTSQMDPTLLWFEPDGRAVPRYDGDHGGIFNQRAEISIRLFNLNELKIRERRRDIHESLSRTIKEAHVQFQGALGNSAVAQSALESAIRRIREAISPMTAHSAAARAMLMAYRVDYAWLDPILAT